MSLSRPFDDPARFRFELLHWIYVTRESLDLFNAALSVANPVATSQSKPKSRAGRKPGSGSYALADQPLVEKMRQLIITTRAKSPHDAAGQVPTKHGGLRRNQFRPVSLSDTKKNMAAEPNSLSPNFSD
jgi:hypothetical protein